MARTASKAIAGEDLELWALLHQCRDVVARARDDELREIGISLSQAAILGIVKAIQREGNGPASPAQLSRWLFREPNTVFTVLQNMVKKGLVEKVKDLERKNLIRVVITDKGEEVYRQCRERRVAVSRIMACLSKQERRHFRTCLEKVRRRALEELRVEYRLPYPKT